ncbi:sugar phosphate nucleotidyltransferase [Paenibacillus sp. LX16]|uniref:sugar phosphate nucleotidyltransferase n=1 Tax=Paenibacillus sp. LX16 TaxID=1740264 RepID=UPI002E2A3F47|nr:sugar phosphate nucleotidyltransferase [Paenibacillus sp. LX16]
MKLILLSGGSGTRLWPLSNDSRSKQFLKILKDEHGNDESMVQRVWRQIRNVSLDSSTFITTSKSQVEMIQSQLNDCPPLIIEPERKDTFPAIALSASYLLSQTNESPDEVVVVLPVDLYVEDDFFRQIFQLEKIMDEEELNIALLGVKPLVPTEKYGYILPKVNSKNVSSLQEVDCFIEKPPVERAKELIHQSALWNCGIFAFKLKYLVGIMENRGLPVQFDEMVEGYNNLQKISFDFEVLEKEKVLHVLPYEGKWKDLGTWDSLVEEMDSKQLGKGIVSDCQQVNLINELDIPVVVLGLSDVVVVASPDGILVSDVAITPQLKNSIKNLNNRPMYEERRWGWFRILDYNINNEDGDEVLTKKICIKKGQNLSYQMHTKRTEIWNIISGSGELVIDNCISSLKTGDSVKISPGQKHSVFAKSDLEIIEIQKGPELIEEDVIRFCSVWDEIKGKVVNSM